VLHKIAVRSYLLIPAVVWLLAGCARLQEAQNRVLAAVHYNRAIEAYIKHRNQDVRRELEKALRFDPAHPEANLLMAQFYLREGKFDQATLHLQRAQLHTSRPNPELLFTLADLYDRAGKYDEAEETYRRVYRANPNNPVAQNNLGYFLANRNRHLSEALQLTMTAVKARPNEGSFVDSLGWVYYRLGDLSQAKRHLLRAKRLEPSSAEIHYHLGIVYRDLHEIENAKTEFLHACDLDPSFQPARDELRKLGYSPE